MIGWGRRRQTGSSELVLALSLREGEVRDPLALGKLVARPDQVARYAVRRGGPGGRDAL